MPTHLASPSRSPELVIALHCSGGGAAQWRKLADALGPGHTLVAPEHYGCDSTGPWTGQHAFRLADEAARTLALIDGTDRKVHLVGHSYGGGVALHVAAKRPDRIASLTLYEPSAFHILRHIGATGIAAFMEIVGIARATGRGVTNGDYRSAAACFVDYWNGQGAWDALRPAVQQALMRWSPKAPLDFAAQIEEPTPLSAYRALRIPTLILCGEHAPAPSRVITQTLSTLIPGARLEMVADAGHMGPLTHADTVNAMIVSHITEVAGTVAAASDDVRRLGNGAIDYDFYRAHARDHRLQAPQEVWTALRRLASPRRQAREERALDIVGSLTPQPTSR